jgi:hypothetical protein
MEPTDKLAIILIIKVAVCIYQLNYQRSEYQGRIQGGGGAPGGPPPKIEKNMILWRKIVISHTKYPKIFRAFLHSAQFF